ncbi:MAG TPA: hypothetical protein ENH46_05615 [Candidatus Pacearchaeota archaeon]|nr:hypothetical protein [Candidatus Pacearchaeota archaeon]
MGDGDEIKSKNLKIYEKDHKRIKELSCAEYGMKQEDLFEQLLSFCLENNPKLEKWYKKKKKQEK